MFVRLQSFTFILISDIALTPNTNYVWALNQWIVNSVYALNIDNTIWHLTINFYQIGITQCEK